MLSQMIKVGLDNKLLLVKKIIDYIAKFEPFLEKSVRDHLGFGDAIPGAIKFLEVIKDSNYAISEENVLNKAFGRGMTI